MVGSEVNIQTPRPDHDPAKLHAEIRWLNYAQAEQDRFRELLIVSSRAGGTRQLARELEHRTLAVA